MSESISRLTEEDLADLPEDDGGGCGCDFGDEPRWRWTGPRNTAGIWRPMGTRALGAQETLA